MVARDQQQSKSPSAGFFAAWSMLRSKAFAVATAGLLPNGLRWLDLALAKLICRSARNCRLGRHFPAAWAGSKRVRPPAPHRPRSSSVHNRSSGYARFAGRLLVGDLWPSKVSPLGSVRRAATGCTVLRLSIDAAAREDRFYAGIDRPTQRGCTFDGTAGLQ